MHLWEAVCIVWYSVICTTQYLEGHWVSQVIDFMFVDIGWPSLGEQRCFNNWPLDNLMLLSKKTKKMWSGGICLAMSFKLGWWKSIKHWSVTFLGCLNNHLFSYVELYLLQMRPKSGFGFLAVIFHGQSIEHSQVAFGPHACRVKSGWDCPAQSFLHSLRLVDQLVHGGARPAGIRLMLRALWMHWREEIQYPGYSSLWQ